MEPYTIGSAMTERDLIFPNSILLPTQDDFATSDTARSAMRALSDRTRQLQQAVRWGRVRVSASFDGTDLKIWALGSCPIYDSTLDRWFLFRGPIPDADLTITPGVLVASTWYYVYAVQSAGVLGFQISTTAPDRLLVGKAGDVVFRYLFCFVTDVGAAIVPFRYESGSYAYERMQSVGGYVSPTGFADPASVINASPRVPPHVQVCTLQVNGNNFSLPGTVDSLAIRKNGGAAGPMTFDLAARNCYFTVRQVLDAAQKFQVILGLNTNTVISYVQGWEE